jgi:hypothetical protein
MTDASLLNRGRVSGSLLMLLGAWGALIPFAGPYFGYAYTPDKAWAYTSGRLWLSIVPGAAAFLGGILVASSARTAAAGGTLAALGGAWFVIGQAVMAIAITTGSITAGSPVASTGAVFGPATMRFLEGLGFFYGVGVVTVFLAALALGKVVAARKAAAEYADRMVGALDREDEYGSAY